MGKSISSKYKKEDLVLTIRIRIKTTNMKFSGVLFLGFFVILNFTPNATENVIRVKSLLTDSLPNNTLIINSFDAMSTKGRKNKKALFRELADSLKQVLYLSTPPQNEGKLIIIPDLINDADSDSTILLIMAGNNASKAIVIKNLDAYFNQTDVEVTKEEGGKKRTASFDICARINYRLYNRGVRFIDSEINSCEFFTQRNVISGLLAAGPDIVGKKKEAFKIVRKNALDYLSNENPWK